MFLIMVSPLPGMNIHWVLIQSSISYLVNLSSSQISHVLLDTVIHGEDLPKGGKRPTSLMSPALADGFFITNTTREAHGCVYIWLSLNEYELKRI